MVRQWKTTIKVDGVGNMAKETRFKLKIDNKTLFEDIYTFLNYDPKFKHYYLDDEYGSVAPRIQTSFTLDELEEIDESGFERIEVE